MRRIMHVDMDAFFAAIELRRRPELAGRPVVVGSRGDPTARGVVATASYEARKFGIHSAMPLRTAYRRCPQATFLPVDLPAYEAVAARIRAVLHQITPLVEDAGLDEAFLDISDDPRSGEQIGRLVKARIREETGLGCSIGIGPNKLLAKIASESQKPDGLTILAEADIASRVWPLPVRRLWGVGPKTEARLARAGIATIGDLARAPIGWLVETFGDAHGRYLSAAANGIDESPIVTHWEPKSMGRQTTFQKDIGDPGRLVQTLEELAAELSTELREEHHVGHRVIVKLRYADFDTHTHGVTLAHATDDAEVIRDAALAALHRFGLTKKVRLIGLRVEVLAQSGERTSGTAPAGPPANGARGPSV